MALIDHLIAPVAFIKAFGPGSALGPEQLSAEIDTLIAQARTGALKEGIELPRFQDALFPVMAWADEHISRSRAWGGDHAWQGFLLQRRYFKTALAGREFFERLEQLPSTDQDLREVYLLCLSLGFQGRYSLAANSSELANIRVGEYRTLQQHDPELAANASELFPHAYQSSRDTGTGRRGFRRGVSTRRLMFILIPPLILLLAGLAMHASLTEAVQQFREAVNL